MGCGGNGVMGGGGDSRDVCRSDGVDLGDKHNIKVWQGNVDEQYTPTCSFSWNCIVYFPFLYCIQTPHRTYNLKRIRLPAA